MAVEVFVKYSRFIFSHESTHLRQLTNLYLQVYVFDHLLSPYDWSIATESKVIAAFNAKFINYVILSTKLVEYFRNTNISVVFMCF